MIRLSIDFKDLKKFDNLIRYIEHIPFVRAEAEMAALADSAVNNMIAAIEASRKRPDKGTHNLENSIDWEEVLNDPGKQLIIGIGNVQKMTQQAPYWEVLDRGGYVPPANLGYFGTGNPPVAGGNGEAWTHTGNTSDFLMIPHNPIEGIDYIGQGLRNMQQRLILLLDKLGQEFISGMGKASK
jgi:hypothetical protein